MADTSTWEFSQTFASEFQATRSALQSQIEAGGPTPTATVLDDLAAAVARLSKALVDATGSLPKYDQKLYENQVKDLEKQIESLRTGSSSKPRFTFKRNMRTAASNPPPPIASNSTLLGPPVDEASDEASIPTSSGEVSTRNLTLEARRYSYIDEIDLDFDGSSSTPDLTISNLSHCIVNLLPRHNKTLSERPFGAYHIRNLTKCIVLLPFCPGSALVHELNNCTLALGCHQFRMHNSGSTDIYLDITSNPIIEGCSKLRFGMYPSKLDPGLLRKPPLSAMTVQDFSHIRNSPSPNFSLMPDKLAIESKSWPLTRVAGQEDIEKTLESLLPKVSND